MEAKKISSKLNKLRCYKVYDYSCLSDNLKKDRDNISVKINREIKKGKIVKIGKGKFYKRNIADSKLAAERISFNKPRDRSVLKHGKIVPSKYYVFKRLFWSNQNKAISLDNFISKILEQDVISYASDLRLLFGDRKVIEVYLNNFYQSNKKPNIEDFLKI